jgi:hypothetical protein
VQQIRYFFLLTLFYLFRKMSYNGHSIRSELTMQGRVNVKIGDPSAPQEKQKAACKCGFSILMWQRWQFTVNS